MQDEEGNEGRQGGNHEERQAGHPGCMPHVWHEDVPDREELEPKVSELVKAGYLYRQGTQPFYYESHIMSHCCLDSVCWILHPG